MNLVFIQNFKNPGQFSPGQHRCGGATEIYVLQSLFDGFEQGVDAELAVAGGAADALEDLDPVDPHSLQRGDHDGIDIGQHLLHLGVGQRGTQFVGDGSDQ